MNITRRGATLGLGLAALPVFGVNAQPAFPSKPLTLIIPFPAGGPADTFGRPLAKGMGERLGQAVVVDNKSGAAGVTGTDVVAKAGTDPHVLGLVSASAGAIMQSLMPKMPYDPAKDIVPITLVVRVQEVLVVSAKLGIDDFKGFVAYAKANPGKLNYASVGAGSVPHLGGVLLNKAAGLDLIHVPYKGAGPATADTVAGQVELLIVTPPSVSGHIRNGNLKALALASDSRLPAFPDIPTTAEAGLPGFILDGWFALFAPAGTPQPIVDKLNAAMRKVGKMEAVVARANQLGIVLKDWTPAQMNDFAKGEVETWGKVIRDNKITFTE